MSYFQMRITDLELRHALHVLDKMQLDIILWNNAEHLMSITKSNTSVLQPFTQLRTTD